MQITTDNQSNGCSLGKNFPRRNTGRHVLGNHVLSAKECAFQRYLDPRQISNISCNQEPNLKGCAVVAKYIHSTSESAECQPLSCADLNR